jgi:hypothetical protein
VVEVPTVGLLEWLWLVLLTVLVAIGLFMGRKSG